MIIEKKRSVRNTASLPELILFGFFTMTGSGCFLIFAAFETSATGWLFTSRSRSAKSSSGSLSTKFDRG